MRTTGPPPYDVLSILPSLKGRERITVRLHPRQVSDLPVLASKIGGPIAWPASEPWPVCNDEAVRYDSTEYVTELTHNYGLPRHTNRYVPVVQLRKQDVPELAFPDGADLFQLLWCPRDHEGSYSVISKIFWRTESSLGPLISPDHQTPEKDWLYVLPQCHIWPERVVEYPPTWELSPEEVEVFRRWMPDGDLLYRSELSCAPGIKVGGYVNWCQEPETPVCQSCAVPMKMLMYFDSYGGGRWNLLEEREGRHLVETEDLQDFRVRERHPQESRQLSDFHIDCYAVFICRNCPGWPIQTVFQCT